MKRDQAKARLLSKQSGAVIRNFENAYALQEDGYSELLSIPQLNTVGLEFLWYDKTDEFQSSYYDSISDFLIDVIKYDQSKKIVENIKKRNYRTIRSLNGKSQQELVRQLVDDRISKNYVRLLTGADDVYSRSIGSIVDTDVNCLCFHVEGSQHQHLRNQPYFINGGMVFDLLLDSDLDLMVIETTKRILAKGIITDDLEKRKSVFQTFDLIQIPKKNH